MNRSISKTLALSGVLLSATGAASADECKFHKSLGFSLPVDELAILDLTAQAGSLRITGEPGREEIVVLANACASSQKLLDGLDISHRTSRDTLQIKTKPLKQSGSWLGNNYAGINLEILIPRTFAVMVDDGSGNATIENVKELYVDDGSGELNIRQIAGPVSVDDGSGAIDLRDIGGRISINDGSGSIDIDGAREDVHIEEDGSGDITIDNVELDVVVKDDGSGDIHISRVGGNVLVGDDGSGEVVVTDVAGSFTLEHDGSGDVRHSNVTGAVSVPEDRR